MTKFIVPLVLAIGILIAVSPAQSQQATTCPPGQILIGEYCQTPAPGCEKLPAKLALARATFRRSPATIDILEFITTRASGRVRLSLHAATRFTNFTAPINSTLGRIRIVHRILASQARLGTGILTTTYNGDADTRPQTLRMRAANNPARLSASRPTLSAGGLLRAAGTVTRAARGVVRVQIQYVIGTNGRTVTLQFKAPIVNGRWSLRTQLSATVRAQLAVRCGTVHSYTDFTGYMPQLIRGESKSFEVLPAR